MNPELSDKLDARLGTKVTGSAATAGGDINRAFRVQLEDGRDVFVKAAKTSDAELPGLFTCEAQGLRWLAEPGMLRVPKVVLACEADELGPACLVLEWIEPGRRSPDYAEQLGTGLALLHRAGAPRFGLDRDNYLATLPQDNRPCESWGAFYAERRLAPLADRAARSGTLPSALVRQIDQLIARVPELVGPEEAPARLHGDLWGGNVLSDTAGRPVLIDPAAYGGQREVDLAMMQLFGGFSRRVFDAYQATYPLQPGHAERVSLYQLYPLLAHVNLFGSGYVPQVERCIERWAPS